MIMRNALPSEAAICYQFIEEAREFHHSMGFVQWHPGYPTFDIIMNDIENNVGYVFSEDGRILGYCCIIIGDELAYYNIEGAWKTSQSYAVVHRMAFGAEARGQGLSGKAFSLIKAFCRDNSIDAIRVDTQEENKIMQHILEREGFEYCGFILFDGGPKLAYEWDR